MDKWTPTTEGADFALTPILEPLAPFQDRMLVLSGLDSAIRPQALASEVGGDHPRACTAWLTGAHAKMTSGADPRPASRSIRSPRSEFGKHTQLASLEVGLESAEIVGACEVRLYLRLYTTRSPGATRRRRCRWRTARARSSSVCSAIPTAPIRTCVCARIAGGPQHPRCGHRGRDAPARQSSARRIAARSTSIWRPSATSSGASSWPRRKSRPQAAEFERPSASRTPSRTTAKLMTDLQVLAWQTDMTRVITFQMGHEMSGRAYPGDRLRRCASRRDASPGRAEKMEKVDPDQHLPHQACSPITSRSCARRRTATARCSITA